MLAMNNDFFDGFPVLFGKKDCIIAEQSFSIGTFATEYLDMTFGAPRQVERLIPALREEMNIFFSSRSATSAALTQQMVNEIWELLIQLPVYNLVGANSKRHLDLLAYMRGTPEQTDKILQPGTRYNLMYQTWLHRLETLDGSLRKFQRDTIFLLDEFIDMTERTPESYAKSFSRFWWQTQTQREMDAEEGRFDEVPRLSHPVHVSYMPVVHLRKAGDPMIAERLDFETLDAFLYADLYRGMVAGHIPRRCDHCKHYFLLTSGHDIRYCNRVAPGETVKTCRQVGAHKKEKERNATEFIRKEYFRTYNRLKARKQRGSISVDEWNRQVAQAQEIKEQAELGQFSDGDYKQKLGAI